MVTNIGVYQLRSKSTKRFYIGSSVNLTRRMKRHFSDLQHHRHHNVNVQKIYDTYGEDDLEFVVLKYFKSKKKANELEDKLLHKYAGHERCLNICDGSVGGDTHTLNPNIDSIRLKRSQLLHERYAGMTPEERSKKYGKQGNRNGMFGNKHSDESKKKMSVAMLGNHNAKGSVRSKETRALLSSIAKKRAKSKGYVNPFSGKKHTEKTRSIIREKALERVRNGVLPSNTRRVCVGSTVYRSVTEAGRHLGCCTATVLYRIKSDNYPDYQYCR